MEKINEGGVVMEIVRKTEYQRHVCIEDMQSQKPKGG